MPMFMRRMVSTNGIVVCKIGRDLRDRPMVGGWACQLHMMQLPEKPRRHDRGGIVEVIYRAKW